MLRRLSFRHSSQILPPEVALQRTLSGASHPSTTELPLDHILRSITSRSYTPEYYLQIICSRVLPPGYVLQRSACGYRSPENLVRMMCSGDCLSDVVLKFLRLEAALRRTPSGAGHPSTTELPSENVIRRITSDYVLLRLGSKHGVLLISPLSSIPTETSIRSK